MPLVLTTFTETGSRQAERVAPCADLITVAPYDLPGAVRRFADMVNPQVLLLVESELWPNTIRLCDNRGRRVAVVSGRVTLRSFRRYRWIKGIVRSVVRRIRCVGAQSEADAERFIALGVPQERIHVTGNLKFAVFPEISPPEETRRCLGIPDGRRVWVAGSTREGEEEIILSVFRELKAHYRDLLLILAPRHIKRIGEVERIIKGEGGSTGWVDKGKGRGSTQRSHKSGDRLTWKRRSQIREGESMGEDILLLDTIGELTAVYGIGEVAFVGGSFVPVGGHNPLEPAAAGIPVVFGPCMTHAGSDLLLNAGAAVSVPDREGLQEIVAQFLEHREEAKRRGATGRQVLQDAAGVVERTMAMLEREGVL
jgi:3-deoxy-D-manno-octulosonic-acid transferase